MTEPQNPVANTVAAAQKTTRALTRSFATITPKPVSWLWPGRIALGKYTTIAGEPGLGKSQLTLHLAACVTTGGDWPEGEGKAPLGSVIIVSSEDDPADTIAPRLMAAGADMAKVHELQGIQRQGVSHTFNLAEDLAPLEDLIAQISDVRLVIIDPISAYLGGTDSHKNADVRALLAPLFELAQRRAVAVLGITHLNKGTGNAMQRFTGSGAFVAAARGAYIVAKDADNPDRRLFLPAKNNLGEDKTGFAYTIQGATVAGGISTSRVVFAPGLVDAQADAVLAAQGGGTDDGAASALDEAIAFLQEELAAGAVPSKQIETAAREAGIAKRTLARAKPKANVKSAKQGGVWVYTLGQGGQECQGCQESPSGTVGSVGTLGRVAPQVAAPREAQRVGVTL
jgi:putative DNA primase/helicase